MKHIIGAGFSGLIAATQFKTADVFEIGERAQSHNALLRFKSDVIARMTGISFRRVRVQKAICMDGAVYQKPTIYLSNMYSKKVTGKILSRSINDISAVDRFIAPNDFYDRLIETIGESRIHWGETIDFINDRNPSLSTIPMNVIADMTECGQVLKDQSFNYKSIFVYVGKVIGADVFQTIYFPGPETGVYRVSITGDTLIVESIVDLDEGDLDYVISPFGIFRDDIQDGSLAKRSQRYGKISPIDERARRSFVLSLTVNHNVYSLGRFAVWKNILLDHLAGDIDVIKQVSANDEYRRLIKASMIDNPQGE